MKARPQFVGESPPLLRRPVFKLGKRNFGSYDVLGIEARTYGCNQCKATDQETACNQKHHGQRDFSDRQDIPQMPTAILTSTLAAVFDVRMQVGRSRDQSWCESKRQRGREG